MDFASLEIEERKTFLQFRGDIEGRREELSSVLLSFSIFKSLFPHTQQVETSKKTKKTNPQSKKDKTSHH